MRTLTIGTRGSLLAVVQANTIATALRNTAATPVRVALKVIRTSGDERQGTAAAATADKSAWVDAIEAAVADGSVDLAIHSGKDVPAAIRDGTTLIPVGRRATPADVVITRRDPATGRRLRLADLPAAAVIGTASLRRTAQLRRLRPQWRIEPLRGNVPTRVAKLDDPDGGFDAVIVAGAGIARLQTNDLPQAGAAAESGLDADLVTRLQTQLDAVRALDLSEPEPVPRLLPAVNQGILAAQYRRDRRDVAEALARLVDPPTAAAFWAERSAVQRLDGDCRSAIGLYGLVRVDTELSVLGRVLSPDGANAIDARVDGPAAMAEELGDRLAERLLADGAAELLGRADDGA
jgi:hydroxymethylbilane synthase